jgi:hypothetical protein
MVTLKTNFQGGKHPMSEKVYRYSFSNKLDIQDIEDSLLLAVFVAECLHGRSRMRLDASFNLEKKKRSCQIDAGTEVGSCIARIFTGFLIREFSEANFRVERLDDALKDKELPPNERNSTMRGLGPKGKFF